MSKSTKSTKKVNTNKVEAETKLDETQPTNEQPNCDELSQQLATALTECVKYKKSAEEMTESAQRMKAEFDNFRKRNSDSVAKARKDGKIDIITQILPLMDVCTNALNMISDDNVKKGVQMIVDKIKNLLAENGVVEMVSMDMEFDPTLHNAIGTVPVDDESKDGKIVEVMQAGYLIGDDVLRHAIVRVGAKA